MQNTTSRSDNGECSKCKMHQRPGDEYCKLVNLYWNVTKARHIVADGRRPIAQDVQVLLHSLAREEKLPDGRIRFRLGHHVDEHHVAHVNPDEPGIAAYALDCYILIDGHHRVARCEQLGRKTFDVYFLSKAESDRILEPGSLRFLRRARAKLAREKDRAAASGLPGREQARFGDSARVGESALFA